MTLPVDVHLLFTIFEEVGSGASAVLHQDVAEMVSVDNATPAPGQNSSEHDVTIAMMDSHGPFNYHLNQQLLHLAREHASITGEMFSGTIVVMPRRPWKLAMIFEPPCFASAWTARTATSGRTCVRWNF